MLMTVYFVLLCLSIIVTQHCRLNGQVFRFIWQLKLKFLNLFSIGLRPQAASIPTARTWPWAWQPS